MRMVTGEMHFLSPLCRSGLSVSPDHMASHGSNIKDSCDNYYSSLISNAAIEQCTTKEITQRGEEEG